MTGTSPTSDFRAHICFIGLWISIMAATTILWMGVVTLADSSPLRGYGSYGMPISLSLWWLLAGFLQSRLLRPHMQRHRLWVFATLVGGSLWGVGLRFLSAMIRSVELWILNSVDPAWMYAPALRASIIVSVAAGLLGFLQSFCFAPPQAGRIVWPVATVVAMLLTIGICLASGGAI